MWDDELDWIQQIELGESYIKRKRWEAKALIMAVAEAMGAVGGAAPAPRGDVISARGKQYRRVSAEQLLARVRE